MAAVDTATAYYTARGNSDAALIFSGMAGQCAEMASKSPMALARKAAGLTQAEAAERLGVSQPAYARWETGAREPNNENLRALSALFGVSVDELLGTVDPAPSAGRTVELIEEARATAIADVLLALRGLLQLARIDEVTADALLALLPPTVQAAQAAREAGDDVLSAVSAVARHEWFQSPAKALRQ